MANEDTRPETQEPEVRDVPATEAQPVPPQETPEEPPKPADKDTASQGRSVLLPLILGGIIAAVIGFGAARMIPGGWPVQDLTPLREEIQRQAQEITALRDQLGAMSQPDLAPLEERISALENPDVSVQDLQSQLDELRNRISEGAIGSDLQAAIDQTQKQLEDARAQAQEMQRQAEAAARESSTAAALARIAGALDSGTPFNAAVKDLRDAQVEVPEALANNANGVPSVTALLQDFPEAARAALDASLRADGDAGWGDRVGAFLRTQTGARSLTPREGDDPDAILSRAEAALGAGNVKGALDEIGRLPLEGQAAMSDWREKAERRVAATEALAQMDGGAR